MIWSLNPVMIMVFASWCLSGVIASLPVTLIAGIVLMSSSVVVNLLALISLHLVAFLQTAVNSKKTALILTQKAYFLRLFGCFLAVYGVSSEGSQYSTLWVFFGLLISLPVMPWNVGFARHYVALTSRAYIDTVVLPALITLVVMGRIKDQVKVEYSQIWDLTLCCLGLATYAFSAIFAGISKRVRWILIHLTQSWLGFGLFALVMDAERVPVLLLGSLLGFVLLGARLFDLGSRQSPLFDAVARVALLGVPGALSFLLFREVLPGVVAMNPLWIIFVFVVQCLHAYALIQGIEFGEHKTTWPSVRYLIALLAQLLLFVGLSQ
ncbi:MAG: hypothetical protein JST80_07390 [Bdellovibrionales bacterium]|nr:hypothetical protein [Bdellovibrionales bacterium]